MPTKEQLESNPKGFFGKATIVNRDGVEETIFKQVTTWKEGLGKHLGAARRLLADRKAFEITLDHKKAVKKLCKMCKDQKCIRNANYTPYYRYVRHRGFSKTRMIFDEVVYRKDLYLFGHPNLLFRSGEELLPHLVWLEYSEDMCPKPTTTSCGWGSRDYAICPCRYCMDWVKRFDATFFTPWRCPVVFEPTQNNKIYVTYDRTGQPGLFRPGEIVWLRFQIETDGKIKEVERPQSEENDCAENGDSGDSTKRNCVWLWPAKVTSRKKEVFKEDGVGEYGKKYKDILVMYSVELLIPRAKAREAEKILKRSHIFDELLATSLLPFVEPNIDEVRKPIPKRDLDDLRQMSIRDASNYASRWKHISEHGVLFGPEVLRIGDVVRLKDPQNQVALRIENFLFDNRSEHGFGSKEFSVEGRVYSVNEDFCLTIPGFCESHSTRVAAWLPISRKAEQIPMAEIAGRLYPVKHPAFEAEHRLASAVWQDWKNAAPMGTAIEITGLVKEDDPRIRQTHWILDDSDIVDRYRIDAVDWYYVSSIKEQQVSLAGWGPTEVSKKLVKKRKGNEEEANVAKRQNDSEEDGITPKRRKLLPKSEDF
ncbi:hypothetical protein HDU96_003203 [Phlyctochytrium bullatum]|nr:hypothetical protein HDU96_003203 [Phlyctochytrium bullatum]